jgi:hypothetical protein
MPNGPRVGEAPQTAASLTLHGGAIENGGGDGVGRSATIGDKERGSDTSRKGFQQCTPMTARRLE